jgi:hypothetical protein
MFDVETIAIPVLEFYVTFTRFSGRITNERGVERDHVSKRGSNRAKW